MVALINVLQRCLKWRRINKTNNNKWNLQNTTYIDKNFIQIDSNINKTMNFIKSNLPESKKRINVILTYRIDESDIKNSEFAHIKIVDFSDILLKNNYHPAKDSELDKLEYLSKEIINSEDNIVIYNTRLSLEDFDTISEMLKPHELIINNILVPNEAKRKQQLAEGQEAYRNHNRWLNFYPGEIEENHKKFAEKIETLKIKYQNSETKIVEI